MTAETPGSPADLAACVEAHDRVHVMGSGSKTALHGVASDVAIVHMTRLSGVSDYQPQEYTLTARAGTPVAELRGALSEKGQYLPFDPLLPDEASIGGTVAANLSGSRRYRYGGIRDFILGARVVDGLGRCFGVGGKVVKNAAGFDLSKFLVGSLGQYAILTEVTFKVFPEAPDARLLRVAYTTLQDALDAVNVCQAGTQELDMLDFAPIDDGWVLIIGMTGFASTLPQRVEQLLDWLRDQSALQAARTGESDASAWDPLSGLTGEPLLKVALPPRQIAEFDARVSGWGRRYSVGGNLAWLSGGDISELDTALRQLGLTGLALKGAVDAPVIGQPLETALASRVKQVLDPNGKFV